MKQSNPDTPILIREATGVQPKLWARYGMLCSSYKCIVLIEAAYGKEKSESLAGTCHSYRT